MSCQPELLDWLEECYEEVEQKRIAVEKERTIDCVIYNNVHNRGIGVGYEDIVEENVVKYKGQTKGKKDSLIKANTTLYLEKYTGAEYRYMGLVTSVKCISTTPINTFELIIDYKYIHNGYASGDHLQYVEGVKKGRGSCWGKRSSLIRLGFSDKGNMVEGIIPVKKRVKN